jgi:integral membrane protein (TIGR01906 family)
MKFIKVLASIAVIILVPVFLLMTSIRILINPDYPLVEYQMPGFPDDPFGFTSEERLNYARNSVEYLLNNEPISFLGELKMADGSPLYNDRELSHMLDVKILVQGMLRAWWIILGVLLLIGVLAWRLRWLGSFFLQIVWGGWATLALVGFLVLSTFLDFSALFTGDTWLFYTSDSLIRLFPERFWSDAFIYIGIFTIAGALIAIFGGRMLSRRFR